MRENEEEPGNCEAILAFVGSEIERLFAIGEKAVNFTEDMKTFPMFLLEISDFKKAIKDRADFFANTLLTNVVLENRRQMKSLCEVYEKMAQILMATPADTAALRKLQDYWLKCEETFVKLKKKAQEQVHQRVVFITRLGQPKEKPNDAHLYGEDVVMHGKVLEWARQIMDFHERSRQMQQTKKGELETVLMARKNDFDDEAKSLKLTLSTLKAENSFSGAVVKKSLNKVKTLASALENAQYEAERINEQEVQVGLDEATDYKTDLETMETELKPLGEMWTKAQEYLDSMHKWYETPLYKLDAEEIENEADTLKRQFGKLKKSFIRMDMTDALKITEKLSSQIGSFMDNMVPLLLLICTPGLRLRHWKKIAEITSLDIEWHQEAVFTEMTEVGLQNYTAAIEETCITAVKEYSLEKAMDKMEEEWQGMVFELTAYRNTGTYIISSIDEIQQVLDDQIVKTQAMRGSRYITPFLDRANKWEFILKNLQDIIDNWLKVQGVWLYLEPIFSSDDINKQMPTEGEMFRGVDNTWRESMQKTVEEPEVLAVAQRKGLVKRLLKALDVLDQIQKGLNDYLETKRLFFPRFFFLSNDELLEILAETKDPLRVQPHLKKCFEGIFNLIFEKNLDITAMKSREKELVKFNYDAIDHKLVNPNDAAGCVEVWLLQVEAVMRRTVALQTNEAMIDVEQRERTEWLTIWPGQVCISVSQKKWTSDVEQAFLDGTLPSVSTSLQEGLVNIVKLVRGKLPKLARKTISAICVIDVHNRDVVGKLVEGGVKGKTDFDWMAQLRYYWDPDFGSELTGKPGSVKCRMILSEIKYANEYLGNSMRLVITPLTDRCYRTLIGAVALDLGGAPEGPAGTGKTETVKDLAKALAMQCVVFNCSDGLDFKAMAKFFKGLASSGAWACFDEFNRIVLEVLSVVAQQILTIQRAKIEQKEKFMFEGTYLSLNRTANAFITMNPGYAGRAELPDNLKALFRTVAMMVPDYAMIAEIILYSMGYLMGKPLSVKIVQCYKLCSEQLSAQRHYDYGMRAVMAVLRASNNLKRADMDRGTGDTDEDVLCLRAIMDVNYAKFLSHDLPLFNGIVGDLFPGVVLPEIDRTNQLRAMRKACKVLKLQPTSPFLTKVVQIYEMMVVRHGFMIVGLPFGAKTSAWKVLQLQMGIMNEWYPEDNRWTQVQVVVINPKALTMGQLYGQFDPVSHEWTDGVIPIYYRNMANNKIGNEPDRKWMLFDGPVDAVWIENMNTVLDDNKKLCLMSGEIIAMSDVMSMMFEPKDLEVASPATVSRVGMIYMEPRDLGWRPLLDSWLEGVVDDSTYEELEKKRKELAEDDDEDDRPFLITSKQACTIEIMFEWLCDPLLEFLRKEVKEQSRTQDHFMVQSMLRIMESFFEKTVVGKHDVDKMMKEAKEGKKRKKKKKTDDDDYDPDLRNKITDELIESAFLVAVTWSICCSTDHVGRAKWNEFIRKLLSDSSFIEKEHPSVFRGLNLRGWTPPRFDENGEKTARKLENPFPEGSIYDFMYVPSNSPKKKGKWVTWVSTLKDLVVPKDADFSSICVPTVYTASFEWIFKLLITHKFPVLTCGPTGTGKSAYIQNILNKQLPRDLYTNIQLGLSAKTSVNMVQSIVDGKLDKRRKGVYGPPAGKKCVIFVDDLNMPEVEEYGAQPPLELIRQLIGSGGWFDMKDKTWRSQVDTQVVAAMGPPGGGRNHVSPRTLRHFNLICFVEFSDETLLRIFSFIVKWHLDSNNFEAAIKKQCVPLVNATIDMYNTARSNLLPTPAKSHYIFNLRDIARVVQGILMMKPYADLTPNVMIKLWLHECHRVFADRLINTEDGDWFTENCNTLVSRHFGSAMAKVCSSLANEENVVGRQELRSLFFGDYMVPGAAVTSYKEVEEIDQMGRVFNQYLDEFNSMTRKKMDLVLFGFAIEHCSRIVRMMRISGGNMLLIGVGGSGRQSLTRLAASVVDYECFQIEISKNYSTLEWREDLKKVLKGAGSGSRPFIFLFSDTQIMQETMVEDINNILNSGEVPNLFATDEKMDICDSMRSIAKATMGRKADNLNANDLYNLFVRRTKDRLHIMLAFSPIGDAFRERMRKFPSLVNCCTIDWFMEWPSDALVATAERFLNDVKVDSDETRGNIVKLCQHFHDYTFKLSKRYLATRGRHNYVTPTSYLELIKAYKISLAQKQIEVRNAKERYVNGVEKIEFAGKSVSKMQDELVALQPVLKQAQIDTDKLMEEIEAALPGVEKIKASVSKEAAVAQIEADKCAEMKQSCEDDLAEAIPALNAAIKALNTLKPADINEVKSLKTPPAGVKLVMQAVCTMMKVKPDKVKDPEGGMKKVNDFWGPSKKLMSDTKFLDKLKKYDKDNIDPKIMEKIRNSGKFCGNPEFTPAAAKKSSLACAGMCQWVLAMEVYDRVAKVVAPKKVQLKKAEAELAVVMAALNEKQDELAVVEGKLKKLQDDFEAANKKKAQLEADVKLCGEKLVRAKELIEGLGGEKMRWQAFANELDIKLNNLTGDVLVSAGVIAYLGPFTSDFRNEAVGNWASLCKELGVPCADEPSLNATLGNPIQTQAWQICGLPADDFSTDNAVIVKNSQRWPLMIDPQGQANKWIRNMEEENAKNDGMPLQVVRQSQSDFLRTIENSVQFGNPVLLENVLEELDPSLEPLLLKQIFKQGGVECIRLGDSTVEYNTEFRFYITTKLPNPHYLPEVAVKVTVLNFMITPLGLEEQLVGIVVAKERPDLEKQKQELIVTVATNRKLLKETEDKILHILSTSEGNILEDEAAIQAIKSSKKISDDIKAKQVIAEETSKKIDEVRRGYQPVAFRAQVLFFCIADLAAIEPVYQYSLTWFVNLFVMGIEKSEKSNNLSERLTHLNTYFTYSLYLNVMRSLLEKDKLLFSFLLTVKIKKGDGEMDPAEWYFLLTGGVAMDNPHMNPTGKSGWLSDKAWGEVCRLSDLESFKGLRDHFLEKTEEWQKMYDKTEAHKAPLPEDWKHLSGFQFLLVLRCIRPDKVMLAVQDYVIAELGRKFVEPPPFDLEACYNDSTCTTPLVFILSPGSDPMASLLKYSEELNTNLDTISLGQGQGPVAVRLINKAKEAGSWVILQNCHLAVSWMKDLEVLCENLSPDTCNGNFRLWLTTYPSPDFPVSVLQNGVKMTNEAPKGLRNNLLGSYTTDPISDETFFNSVKKGEEFRKLLYSLCFFHALIQERRQFGALGWNIPYEFNESDLRISVRQLAIFLDDDKPEVPFKALKYTAGECNYGGRVTDDHDRTTLRCILDRFYAPSILEDNCYLGGSEKQKWNMLPDGSLTNYVDNISNLPLVAEPEIFGMHPNANITKDQNETTTLFSAILVTENAGSGADVDMEGVVTEVADSLLQKLPPNFDMEEAALKYPIVWNESMNTVLNQELLKFNVLSSCIRDSLINVKKAIKGLIVMGDALEKVYKSLFFGRVPDMWAAKSYPSLKPLAGYFADFLLRIQMFAEWLGTKPPAVFWMSGFYFTQAFLTGTLQNFARKYTIPIDQVVFDFAIMPKNQYQSKPKDGVYVHGLFLEGCRYDKKTKVLEESEPKVLYTLAPIIWLKPKQDDHVELEGYSCPVYKTSERRGMLSTTGHSTNFVMMIQLPSAKPSSHWTGRGVAMLTQLDD
eukprot:g4511.t1